MKKITGLLVPIFLVNIVSAQNFTIPLWEKDIPNFRQTGEKENAHLSTWPERCTEWLKWLENRYSGYFRL